MNNFSFWNAAISSEGYEDIRTTDDEVDYKQYLKYFWYFDDINSDGQEDLYNAMLASQNRLFTNCTK